jgi:hypothetical protein
MTERRQGDRLLEAYGLAAAGGRYADQIVEFASVTREAMKRGFGPRGRTLKALAEADRAKRDEYATLLRRVDPYEVEHHALEALRTVVGEPLQLRVGVQQIDKQAHASDAELWPPEEIPPGVRGARKPKTSALMLVVSKVITDDGIFDGPTRQLRSSRPRAPEVTDLVNKAWEVNSSLTVIDLRVDQLMRNGPFSRELGLLKRLMAPGGNRTLVLPLDPGRGVLFDDGRRTEEVNRMLISEHAWQAWHALDIAGPRGDETYSVAVSMPGSMSIDGEDEKPVSVRLARVRAESWSGAPPRPSAFAVFGGVDQPRALELVAQAFERGDDWPPIARFRHAREVARVHRGECRTPRRLHSDRAVASLAFNAALLDGWMPALPAVAGR